MFGRIRVIVDILCTAGIYCTLLHSVPFQKRARLNHNVSFRGLVAHCPRRPPPLHGREMSNEDIHNFTTL